MEPGMCGDMDDEGEIEERLYLRFRAHAQELLAQPAPQEPADLSEYLDKLFFDSLSRSVRDGEQAEAARRYERRALPPAQAWPLLMDIKRIAPCMPGAELTEVVDDKTYKGKIGVRLGPVALTFAGTVTFEEINNANHSARVKAQGTDAKGRGGANATASFRLEPVARGSKVLVHTDLALSGSVAQYGRGVGMIQATAAQLINQFAG